MPTVLDRPHRLRRLATAATWLLVLSSTALSTSLATAQEAPPAPTEADNTNDPLEPINRGVFWFNELLDVVLLRPAAEIYREVVPDPAQTGVRNALRNLRSPLDLANQTLQGDWDGAGNVLKRFALNTTVGIGGLIDVAAQQGIPYEYESFDQTLAVWGVPEGPYLVLPLIGASSVRDAVGFGAEYLGDPVSLYASNNDLEWANYTRAGLTVLDTRAGYIDVIDDLRRNSFDYYAAMRSLYRQRRDGWIRDGAPDASRLPDIPDYEAADQ
ncbi:VacJ family lipoprotein [Oleisolibacter albus]|uniref:MlaA family lipoprotein n=1 Tax=Oleisolibacter albus TaxID=2171757 RepID=UPI001EFD45A1|nr:VacJ family lipoprotein [Oleisolibacter albus]